MGWVRQGPRLTLKKVRRENEVPKKRDFNFDGRYLSQMSLFSPKWGIFGTAHAWIFRISWETQKKFTNIVAGAPRVSSPSFAKFLSSVFLTLTTLVFVSPAFLISQSSLLFIVTQHHVYLKCISQLTTQVFVSMTFLISQSSLLFIVTQYHGNKYGGMRGKLQPFTNFWNLLLLWLLRAPTPSQVPRPTCWWKSGGDPVYPTP